MDCVKLYLTATSRHMGALGIFHLYAPEDALAADLDARLGSRSADRMGKPMADKELRHGWLHDADGGIVDEVMLARPSARERILMTHGGTAVREAVERFLTAADFLPLSEYPAGEVTPASADPVYDPLLAGCITGAQVAAVLDERERAAREGRAPRYPEGLLRTHRVLLAGAPNAGKSSLLNRLAGHDRAFVHREAGATRDVVDELVDLGGFAVFLGDLPGFVAGGAGLAAEAWRYAREKVCLAEMVWFVHDASCDWREGSADAAAEIRDALGDAGGDYASRVLVLLNKSDLPVCENGEPWRECFPGARSIHISALPEGNAREEVAKVIRRLWLRL